DDVRAALERAQHAYFVGIFQEAASGGNFGLEFFEQRLEIGTLHNKIDLPLKWYLGSYVQYFDLVRSHLRRRFPLRPRFRAHAERAVLAVMNQDAQAIVEALYFDTFAAMGVDLAAVTVGSPEHDLSDCSAELKS